MNTTETNILTLLLILALLLTAGCERALLRSGAPAARGLKNIDIFSEDEEEASQQVTESISEPEQQKMECPPESPYFCDGKCYSCPEETTPMCSREGVMHCIEEKQAQTHTPETPKETEPEYDSGLNEELVSKYNSLTDLYEHCIGQIETAYSKVNLINDQRTLYTYDEDVLKCVEAYEDKATGLGEYIEDNNDKLYPADVKAVRNNVLTQINNIRSYSSQYLEASQNRHYYIHGEYQTNQLVDLVGLVGNTAGSIGQGDPISTAQNLLDLYDWWYYNGGVVDTGW